MEQNMTVLDYAQHLAEQGKREEALSMLTEVNCMRANWIKGNMYYAEAQEVANSFLFRNYCTESLITKYRQLLNQADGHLRNVVEMIRGSGSQVSKSMTDLLWTQLGRIEMELLGTKPAEVDEEKEEYLEDVDEKEIITDQIENLAHWMNKWDM